MFLSSNSFNVIKRLVSASAVSMAFIGGVQAAPEAINIAPNGDTIWADTIYGNQAISANGSLVIIQGFALPPNQVPMYDPNRKAPVWSRDRQSQSTQMLSKTLGGQAANSYALGGVSADGKYVAFDSFEDSLVPGDTNGAKDAFVVNRQTGLITRVNITDSGAQAENNSGTRTGGISADGRYVVFTSTSQNLLQATIPDSYFNAGGNIFVRDLIAGTTKRISVTSDNSNGIPPQNSGGLVSLLPRISGDGRFVAFFSSVVLAPNGTGFYIRDQLAGTTSALPISGSVLSWELSANGRYLAYHNTSNNSLEMLDRQSNTIQKVLQFDNSANSIGIGKISISANARYWTYMAANKNNNTSWAVVYDTQTKQSAKLTDFGVPASAGIATLSADGRHILAGTVALANPLFADDGFCSIYNPYVSQ